MLSYQTKKNFLSPLSQTSGEASVALTTGAENSLAMALFDLLEEKLRSGNDTLINLQGKNATELFYLHGTVDDPGSDTGETSLVEIIINSKFLGNRKRGEFLFGSTIRSSRGGDVHENNPHEARTVLTQASLIIEKFRFGLEWLFPHYFSWMGFAPTVEDFFHIEKLDSVITCRFGGERIAKADKAPIKDISGWNELESVWRKYVMFKE